MMAQPNDFGNKCLKKDQCFDSVYDLEKNRYHPTPKGIYYIAGQAAQSILVTNKYERDSYCAEDKVLRYEGSYHEPDNEALYKSMQRNIPVRVFVSHRSFLPIAPKKGVAFVGMYRIVKLEWVTVPGPTRLIRPVFSLVEQEE